MFTQPAPAATTPGLASSLSPPPVVGNPPITRPSRLRLTTLYNNFVHQAHLLSRDPLSAQTGHRSGSGSESNQSPTPVPTNARSSRLSASVSNQLFRAYSFPTSTSSTSNHSTDPPSRSNRTTLVPAATHPLAAAATPPPTRSADNLDANRDGPYTLVASVRPSLERSLTEPLSAAPPVVSRVTAPGTRSESGGNPARFAVQSDTPLAGVDVDSMTRTRSLTATDDKAKDGGAVSPPNVQPSIRFTAFYDQRAQRPSLTFSPISRTLPTGAEVIRVGRYSERDSQPAVPINVPSSAPVGFKSKVVSRRHCEFWHEGGKWYIKDVKSSSGTFLNHIRLSPPGTESKPFPINDGDIVQLGIDFKGGEEMIFRCVKMRLELNRGWQNKLNTFNMATHKRLRNMTSSSAAGSASSHSQDCSICLNRISPCQSLFVAPCSHTWHYKCIKGLLASPSYPIFHCPNCRAAADLEADIDDQEEWEQLESDEGEEQVTGMALDVTASLQIQGEAQPRQPRDSIPSVRSQRSSRIKDAIASQQPQQTQISQLESQPSAAAHGADGNGDSTMMLDPTPQPPLPQSSSDIASHATSDPMPIPNASGGALHQAALVSTEQLQRGDRRTPSPNGIILNGHEGPITPRNDAGPWVFDGSGVRIASLGAAVTASEDTEMRMEVV